MQWTYARLFNSASQNAIFVARVAASPSRVHGRANCTLEIVGDAHTMAEGFIEDSSATYAGPGASVEALQSKNVLT